MRALTEAQVVRLRSLARDAVLILPAVGKKINTLDGEDARLNGLQLCRRRQKTWDYAVGKKSQVWENQTILMFQVSHLELCVYRSNCGIVRGKRTSLRGAVKLRWLVKAPGPELCAGRTAS